MARRLLALSLLLCFGWVSVSWSAQKKKKKKAEEEEITQTLEIPKDPPAAVVADASRLVFIVSPLSAKGLLSQQIRDGLKTLFSQSRGAQIVKIRAFVAGSGDLRRVPSLVSEIFTDKRMAIPAVTVVQVGALPLVGAQVLLEATAVDKKVVNPQGLAFVSGQPGSAKDAGLRLTDAIGKLSLKPESVRQSTCYIDSLDFEADLRKQMIATFPKVVLSVVQVRRDSAGEFSECEAVASLNKAPERSPSVFGVNERYSQGSFVGPVRVALTGTQMAFGREDKDIRLALDRMGKALEGVGASWQSVVKANTYLLTGSIRDKYRVARGALAKPQEPPASTMLMFEGLPSLDASFAIDTIAVTER